MCKKLIEDKEKEQRKPFPIKKMNRIDNGFIDYKSELLRKSIHLCSLSIPVVYYFISKEEALFVLVPLMVISLILDLGRYFSTYLGNFIYKVFGFLLREHEKDHVKKNLSGATYVLISAVLTIFIFPKVFAITAFAVLILGDIAAALIGRKFGRHKFLAKSLEGTTAFFLVSCMVILISPKITGLAAEYLIGICAVAVGAIVENISYGWADDNLTIPLSVGLIMFLLYSIFLPGMQLTLAGVPF